MDEAPKGNGAFQKWVISELKDIKADMRYVRQEQLPGLEDDLTNVRLDVRELQTKALIAGGSGGIVVAAIVSWVVGRLL